MKGTGPSPIRRNFFPSTYPSSSSSIPPLVVGEMGKCEEKIDRLREELYYILGTKNQFINS